MKQKALEPSPYNWFTNNWFSVLELNSQNQYKNKKPNKIQNRGRGMCACNPSSGELETDRSWRLAGQSASSSANIQVPKRGPVSNNKVYASQGQISHGLYTHQTTTTTTVKPGRSFAFYICHYFLLKMNLLIVLSSIYLIYQLPSVCIKIMCMCPYLYTEDWIWGSY